ncbi:hypothetical protein B0H14DRAFT_2577640 [Mycena olivaceomarginata]|nr:hypothetical protein B0H14DRAFT_2577640 [Mycena olivaceomarginata]
MKTALLLSFVQAAVAIPYRGDSSSRPGGSSTLNSFYPNCSDIFQHLHFNPICNFLQFQHLGFGVRVAIGQVTTGEIVAYGTGGKYRGHFSPLTAKAQRRDGSLSNCRDATTDEIKTSDPSCSSQSTSTTGNSQGTENATLETQVQQGVSTSYTTTTEETSQFTWSDSISINVELEIVSMEVEQSISLSLTNMHGSQDTASKDDQFLNVTTCNFSAQNTIDFYLTGYIWSSFKTWFRDPSRSSALAPAGGACANLSGKDLDKCYDNNQCKEHGHYSTYQLYVHVQIYGVKVRSTVLILRLWRPPAHGTFLSCLVLKT